MFVTFEGIDGCGKTTQLALLEAYLKNKGVDVLRTREPGGSSIGPEIRKLILERQDTKLSTETELFLFLAERLQHLHEVIDHPSNQDKFILCDRYHDATIAYQGGGRGLDLNWLKTIEKHFIKTPDLTFWFDLPVSQARERLNQRGSKTEENNQFDNFNHDFHSKVQQMYQNLHQEHPLRIQRIDASQSPEKIHQDVIEVIEHRCKDR